MQKVFNTKTSEIYFYFPEANNLKLVPKKILDMIRIDKMNNLLGYSTDLVFLEDYKYKLGKNKKKFEIPKDKDILLIQKIILEFEDKINKVLKFKKPGCRYFVFPWCPTEIESKKFKGVCANAPYYRTVHLYIDVKKFTKKGLEETLAHELNHIKFFENYKDLNFTIQDYLIAEGLAECFREDFVGGKVAPWSNALNKIEIQKSLQKIQTVILSRDREIYGEIFFGGKQFKIWTGYSVGYFLVKEFLKKNQNISWDKMMKTNIKKFFSDF